MVLLESKAIGFKPKAIGRLPAVQMMVVVLVVVVVCGWGDTCVIGAPLAPSRSLTRCNHAVYCMVCKCVAKMQLLLLLLQSASLIFCLVLFGSSRSGPGSEW